MTASQVREKGIGERSDGGAERWSNGVMEARRASSLLQFAICDLLFAILVFHRTTTSESRNHLVPSIRPGVFISTLT